MKSIGMGNREAHDDGKVRQWHLERAAIVYVRQSTLQQVDRNSESTRLQYALVERARLLGWRQRDIVVIDEDLGKSAQNAEGRPGFQRLVAEVSLNRVGIVLGIEMSRLARSCRDWYQLLEVCALFRSLIADAEGVYDPTLHNDRLLLGLKGTLSEAELHMLKQRMLEGKRAKARRGELPQLLPVGFMRESSGRVVKDPDEQARSRVSLVFEQFSRLRTVNSVLRYFVNNSLRLPYRVPSGEDRGTLQWRRANRVTLQNMLRNPAYAGAYVHGRRPTDPRKKVPGRVGTGRVVVAQEHWQVLIRGKYPEYISWEQYMRNQETMRDNRTCARGTPRGGSALLSGIIVCGRCRRRMNCRYSRRGATTRYDCIQGATHFGEHMCMSIDAHCVDRCVAEGVLDAVAPASLEISLKVAEDVENEYLRLRSELDREVERAQFESQRAHRQYCAVEPENRLVARTLEGAWERCLEAEAAAEEKRDQFTRARQQPPTENERETIRKLAKDVPAIWYAPTTTNAERQAIVRQLVDRVIVTVEGETEKALVDIEWVGGWRTQRSIVRPVRALSQLSYHSELISRVKALHLKGRCAEDIAKDLNGNGLRPPKRRATFNKAMVERLLLQLDLRRLKRTRRKSPRENVNPRRGEWTLLALARELDMPDTTLYYWLRRGDLPGRKASNGVWLVRAKKGEVEELRRRRQRGQAWRGRFDRPAR